MIIRQARIEDLNEIKGLLEKEGLPLEGVAENLGNFLVAEAGERVVGSVGLEIYGTSALLRSVVVTQAHRGTGIGTKLHVAIIASARKLGIKRILLLTNTAEEYFRRKGFRKIDRLSVTGSVAASSEFTHACPSSAVCMEMLLH